MTIVMIGAGRLASSLAPALKDAGHDVTCVYSRTLSSAQRLADRVGAKAVTDVAGLPTEADAFVVAVKDSVLADVCRAVAKGREQQLLVHTAGSMSLDVFPADVACCGVLYPMQTFSMDRTVDFSAVPVFIEAGTDTAMQRLEALAASVSSHVYRLDSSQRRYLHLAAVFACNFVNHCYALSADVLRRCGLPFDVMLPLIDETARKVHHIAPVEAQTGPAVRYDENVISMQSNLLADHPAMQRLYDLLSENIHAMSQAKSS